MAQPLREIDFERWYRELYQKYILARNIIEAREQVVYSAVLITVDSRVKLAKEGIRVLKSLIVPFGQTRHQNEIIEIEKKFESYSAFINTYFRELHSLSN